MNLLSTRTRLLGSAAVGLGLTLVAASPAQAACTIAAGVLTCTSTTTTDTVAPANAPNDRGYDTPAALTAANVGAGVTVDGFGLAFNGFPSAFTFTNNGAIQVNAGTPTVGGDAALAIWSTGNAVTYLGTGTITHLGVGSGFEGRVTTGAGTVSATFGGNVRADAGTAILLSGQSATTGALSATTAAGTTVRASGGDGIGALTAGTGNVTITNGAAISSGGAGVNTLQDGIQVTSTGTAGNVSVANTGAIGTAADRAQLTGISTSITNAASAGTTSVTGSGAISSVGDGINASTAGTGTVTVNYTGSVNSTTGDGIDVDAVNGNISVTTGAGAITTAGAANSAITAESTGTGNVAVATGTGAVTGGFNGVLAVATTGTNSVTTGTGAVTGSRFGVQIVSNGVAPAAQTVTINGAVTGSAGDPLSSGIRSFTDGARTITINAAGNVTGAAQAIELVGTGATTIANAGTIGSLATGIAINDFGGGNSTITNTGTLNGRVLLGGGTDTLTNSGTMNVNGVMDFGAGTGDTFTNAAAGTLNILGNTSFTGLETYATNAGRINLNTFTLTGPAATLTNTGTIDTNGSAGLLGFTALTNNGTIDLAAGTFTVPAGVFTNGASGIVIADEGATTITGQSSFANAGAIRLNDGATGDQLTIVGPYVGSGAANLNVDVSSTAGDLLIITGAASGSTRVNVTPVGTIVVDFDGIQVVDTGAALPAGAFVIGNNIANGLINFDIEQRGNDAFVIARPNASAFDAIGLPNMGLDMWYQSADIYTNYAAMKRSDLNRGITGLGVWVQGYLSRDKYGEARSQDLFGATFSVDVGSPGTELEFAL